MRATNKAGLSFVVGLATGLVITGAVVTASLNPSARLLIILISLCVVVTFAALFGFLARKIRWFGSGMVVGTGVALLALVLLFLLSSPAD